MLTQSSNGLSLPDRPAVASSDAMAFERDGFFVARGLLTNPERARAALADAVRPPDSRVSQSRVFGNRGLPGTVRLSGLAGCHAFFSKLCNGGVLHQGATALIGPTALFRDVWVSKPAGTEGSFSPHQDSAYWDVSPPHLVSAWVSIGDSGEDNGGLQVIPGSHRAPIVHDVCVAGRPLPAFATRALRAAVSLTGTGDAPRGWGQRTYSRGKAAVLEALSRRYPALQGLSQLEITAWHLPAAKPVAIRCSAGDVVFFHSCTVHCSGPNRGTSSRDAYIASFRQLDTHEGRQPVGFVPSPPRATTGSPGGKPFSGPT